MGALRTTTKIGSHRVLWTPDGGAEVDLGYTAEGCEVVIKETQLDLEADELAAPYDAVTTKFDITAKVQLIEVSSMDTIATALNALKTTVVGPPAGTSVDLSPVKGRRANFGKLVLRPIQQVDGVIRTMTCPILHR